MACTKISSVLERVRLKQYLAGPSCPRGGNGHLCCPSKVVKDHGLSYLLLPYFSGDGDLFPCASVSPLVCNFKGQSALAELSVVPGLVRVIAAGGSGAGDSSEYPCTQSPPGKRTRTKAEPSVEGLLLLFSQFWSLLKLLTL